MFLLAHCAPTTPATTTTPAATTPAATTPAATTAAATAAAAAIRVLCSAGLHGGHQPIIRIRIIGILRRRLPAADGGAVPGHFRYANDVQ